MTKTTRNPHPFLAKIEQPAVLSARHILLYGPSGVGKTTFIGSAAFDSRTSPVCHLDFDGGGSTLAGIDPKLLVRVPIRDWKDYSEAYDYLTTQPHPFRSVAIDSLTETHIFGLLSIVDAAIQDSKRRSDPYEVEQGDYGKAMVMLRRLLRAFRALPLHVFYTALAKTEVEPREGAVKKPMLFGQMSDEVVGLFDTTAYLSFAQLDGRPGKKVEPVRVLVLQNEPSVRVKVRTGWGQTVPNYIPVSREHGVSELFDVLEVPQTNP